MEQIQVAPKGYTSVDAVQSYLGMAAVELDGAQIAEIESTIAAVESYIDTRTKRQWNVAPITAERYDLAGAMLLLRQAPVASIELIRTRSTSIGDPLLTLIANVEYELIDPVIGQVSLMGRYGRGLLAFVSYTPNRPCPNDIARAATAITGSSVPLVLNPDRYGIKSIQVENLKYVYDGVELTIPKMADDILTNRTFTRVW